MDLNTDSRTEVSASHLSAPSAVPTAAGSIQISGDPDFDSDSIRNPDANQWRWLSFPGSRLTLNPVPERDAGPEKRWVEPPLSEELRLDLGGFIKNKVFRLMDLCHVSLIDKNGGEQTAAFRSSTWYPYKISFDAAYPGDAHIFGADFLPCDGDVALRTMTVEGARGEHLHIGGTIPDGTVAYWNASSRTLCFTAEAFSYGLAFLRPENGAETPLKLSIQPRITGTTWELEIPLLRDVENLGIAFAFAPGANEEAEVAVRIDNAIALPMDETLAVAKSRMDALLAKVPMPTLWGCGMVPSDQSIHVEYAGKELGSRMECFWKVDVETSAGEAVSAPAIWSMGLLKPEDWEAKWISCKPTQEPGESIPAHYFRKEFALPGAVKRATAYVCGLGFFNLHINGKKNGDHLMDPALTLFPKRVFYVTFDVTEALRAGGDALVVVLGSGPVYWRRHGQHFGLPRLFMQLEVEMEDERCAALLRRKAGCPRIRAAPGHGFESDKFNPEAFAHHFKEFHQKLLDRIRPRRPRRGLSALHLDSWKSSSQNWAASFSNEFRKRRGYDPQP